MYVCMYVSMCVHSIHPWLPGRSEEGVRSSGSGVWDGSEPPHKCWEMNLGPLQKQKMLLTTEPSIAPVILLLCTRLCLLVFYWIFFHCVAQAGLPLVLKFVC